MSIKNVLITGANKSIGYETARQFGRLGFRIWLGSREIERGRNAAEQLSAEGCDVRPLTIDVTEDLSVAMAVARVRDAGGRLDVLINNAGILGEQPTAPSLQSVSDMRAVYETNVFGPVRVTQAFLPLLKAADHASIVMVSSGLGSAGSPTRPTSSMASTSLAITAQNQRLMP